MQVNHRLFKKTNISLFLTREMAPSLLAVEARAKVWQRIKCKRQSMVEQISFISRNKVHQVILSTFVARRCLGLAARGWTRLLNEVLKIVDSGSFASHMPFLWAYVTQTTAS